MLAVLNAGASDAIIACFDAKYHYWTIRPSQADPTIVLADSVGLPNFPSFPSGHACSAGARPNNSAVNIEMPQANNRTGTLIAITASSGIVPGGTIAMIAFKPA